MLRLTAVLFLSASLGFQAAAQQAPAAQTAETPQTATSPSTTESSQFPLDRFQNFSALMTGGAVPGTDDEIHIYRSGALLRMEGLESHNYMITDLAKQETHGLASTGCIKYANAYVRSYPFSMARPDAKYQIKPAGRETVDGHVCQIEELTISAAKLPAPVRIRLWEAEDLQGFPIKIETMAHRVIHYRNVVLGPQDPTLFIVPNECQVFDPDNPDGEPSKPKKSQ